MSARAWQLDPVQDKGKRRRPWVKRQLSRLERRRRKDPEASTDRRFEGYSS